MTVPASIVARPFMPAKDFALSKAFYEALGFKKLLDSEVAIFSCGGTGGFVLQNAYAREWAENFMMQLMVEDLDAWWTHIYSLDLAGRVSSGMSARSDRTRPRTSPDGYSGYCSNPATVLKPLLF